MRDRRGACQRQLLLLHDSAGAALHSDRAGPESLLSGWDFFLFFNYSFNFYLFIFYSTLCSVQISPGAAGGWADGF